MTLHARYRDAPWQGDRWPNFAARELACRCAGRFCAGEIWLDASFMDALQALRNEAGKPFIITSGHRCAQWNASVGGAPLSRHRRLAVDISLRGHERFALRRAAIAHGFTGIGCAQTFLHLDRRTRPALWHYGQRSETLWQATYSESPQVQQAAASSD